MSNGHWPRIIMHIDMNAFFASVEQQDKPHLRGKAVAVVGSAKRTVITTASYEARRFGVKTGMTMHEGRKKCPDLILVTGNHRRYMEVSTEIMKTLRHFSPLIEVCSIDEAYLDVTGCIGLFGSAERVAHLIKHNIKNRFGLTCSIGISTNKLLAKLASDMKKPDGLVIIDPSEVQRLLESVPVKDLCGIGPKTARQLSLYGISTCGQLARFPVELLRRRFGIVGDRLHLMGHGIDHRMVIPLEKSEETKTIGHSMTFDHDLTDEQEMLKQILRLSEMVGRRARKHRIWGKTVTLSIRYADFHSSEGKQETLPRHINRSEEIYEAARALLRTVTLAQPVRLLGVRLGNLSYQSDQLPLFGEERKRLLATEAMDLVNSRFGEFTVTFGSLIGETGSSAVISPSWQPEGVRRVEVV